MRERDPLLQALLVVAAGTQPGAHGTAAARALERHACPRGARRPSGSRGAVLRPGDAADHRDRGTSSSRNTSGLAERRARRARRRRPRRGTPSIGLAPTRLLGAVPARSRRDGVDRRDLPTSTRISSWPRTIGAPVVDRDEVAGAPGHLHRGPVAARPGSVEVDVRRSDAGRRGGVPTTDASGGSAAPSRRQRYVTTRGSRRPTVTAPRSPTPARVDRLERLEDGAERHGAV